MNIVFVEGVMVPWRMMEVERGGFLLDGGGALGMVSSWAESESSTALEMEESRPVSELEEVSLSAPFWGEDGASWFAKYPLIAPNGAVFYEEDWG